MNAMRAFLNRISVRLRPRTVRGRIFVIIGPVMLLSIVLIVGAVAVAVHVTEVTSWRDRQQQTASNAAQTVQTFLDRANDSLAYAGLHFADDSQRARQLQAIINQNPSLLEIVRVDADGVVLASADRDRSLLASSFTIPQSQWFQSGKSGQLYFSSVQLSFQGEPYLILARPGDDPGEVIAARLRLQELWLVVENIQLGDRGTVYLSSSDGQVIAHRNHTIVESSLTLADSPGYADLLKAGDPGWYGYYTNWQSESVAGATATVPATGWVIIAELPQAELFRFTALSLVFVLAVGFGVTSLAMVLARRFVQSFVIDPIQTVRQGVQKIGEGELTFRIALSGEDEVGQVAANFNRMADSLQVRSMQIRVQQAQLEDEIAERKEAEARLRELNAELEARIQERTAALKLSEERYAVAVRGANDGLWDWDLDTDVLHLSTRWKAILGYDESELADRPESWLERIHPEDAQRVREALAAHLQGRSESFAAEYRLRHRDGTQRWVLSRGLALRDAKGRAYRIAGSLSDVSDRKVIEHQLIHEATHDPLTGLPNRAHFRDLLAQALERTRRRNDRPLAVLFVDLDRFKVINDSLGHHSGDQLLITTADRIASCLRDGDVVARLGGDEFALVIAAVHDQHDAAIVAARIQNAISTPIQIEGHDVFTTASIGIALSLTGEDSPEEMLKRADLAMYQAKARGKARHEFFDAQAGAGQIAALHLEVDLRKAVETEQFVLHYQPIVSMTTHEITGVEALVRWQHPERGLVLPGEFIRIAEETGLIVPLGDWVLKTACRQASAWHAAGWPHLRMTVNVSVAQLHHPGFIDQVRRAILDSSLPTPALELEITESAALSDVDQTLQALLALRLLGVSIAIDDFGNSYSALGYLKQLPINTLKIDRSFVTHIFEERNDSAIVSAIVAMASVLNINVVAEGVENMDQYDVLAGHRCGEVQGFLLSRPAPSEAITRLLATGPEFWPEAPRATDSSGEIT